MSESTSEAQLQAGSGNFLFKNTGSDFNGPIRVWSYRLKNLTRESPIVFVMHGVNRDAERYLNDWILYAEQYHFLLICPEFDAARFTTSAYQCGNMFDASKQAVSKRDWAFTTIDNLFDFVRLKTDNASKKYYIFGHSAGGQFVHRFVLFSPSARYARAIAANLGRDFYTDAQVAGAAAAAMFSR